MKSYTIFLFALLIQIQRLVAQEIKWDDLHASFEIISNDRGKLKKYFGNVFLNEEKKIQVLYRAPLIVEFLDGEHVLHKQSPIELISLLSFLNKAFRIDQNRIVLLTHEIDSPDHESWYVVTLEFLKGEWSVKAKSKLERMDGKPPSDLAKVNFDYKDLQKLIITIATKEKMTTIIEVSVTDLSIKIDDSRS